MELPAYYSELTTQERRAVREEYVRLQNGLCHYCGSTLNWSAPKEITDKPINWDLFPEGFLKYPTHLHHDHDTDLTLGAVHNYCNAVLWQYEGE